MELPAHPVLTCAEAIDFEKRLFGDDPEAEWRAMNAAGEAAADSLLRDMRELRTVAHRPRFLILVGKGHNGGDAVVAARRLLKTFPTARAWLWPVAPWEDCRSNVQRARKDLLELAEKRVRELPPVSSLASSEALAAALEEAVGSTGFHACLDGLLGMQFRPPLREPIATLLSILDVREDLGQRAALDLPTGLGDESDSLSFRADYVYATGIVKAPLLAPENASRVGRIRYLDLGFFDGDPSFNITSPPDEKDRPLLEVLPGSAIRILRRLRPALCDKRDFGHLLLIGGSRRYPGALLMAAKAALRSGAGLLTVFVPESLHSAFAAALPEAMWTPMPETPDGNLSLEGRALVAEKLCRATALVAGPGLGMERESHVLVTEILKDFSGPAILDADALRPEIVREDHAPERLVLTPHAGEFARLAGEDTSVGPRAYASATGVSAVVLKGPNTRICSSDREVVNISGGPLLARGGSGDLLAGIVGSLAARPAFAQDLFAAASLGVLWHGRAADALARQHGQEAVLVTEILDYLSFALRNDF